MANKLLEYEYRMPKPDADFVRQSIVYKLIFTLGVDPREAKHEDWLNAAMFAARDLMTESYLKTRRSHIENKTHGVLPLHGIFDGSRVCELIDQRRRI